MITIKDGFMTANDIKDVQLLVNLKDGQKLFGVTDDPFVLIVLANSIKFAKVDETKFESIPLKDILKM